MLDNNIIQSTSSWPFVEVRKLLKDRKAIISKKKKITFQTGYGPSGLPHIGTFGEVARTTMMINALNHIQKIDRKNHGYTAGIWEARSPRFILPLESGEHPTHRGMPLGR